jgi:hypothetical protein
MGLVLLLVLVLVVVGGFAWVQRQAAARRRQELADAEAEARRWYERLGGQVLNLSGSDLAVRQALADAGERYNAAGSQLEQARTAYQFRLARETALEGLLYAKAARIALGMDPGPALPPLAAAQGTGQLTERREVEVEGETFRAGPEPGDDTPYYYPGGRVQGRPVPAGWYSQPIWRPALAGALGGLLVANLLFPPVYGLGGHQPATGATGADGADGAGAGTAETGTAEAGDPGGADFGGTDFGGGFDLGGGFDFGI